MSMWEIVLPAAAAAVAAFAAAAAGVEPAVISTPHLRFSISPDNGAFSIADVRSGAEWRSNPFRQRFGAATVVSDGARLQVELARCRIKTEGRSLSAEFQCVPAKPDRAISVTITAGEDQQSLDFSWNSSEGLAVESIRLLDEALGVSAGEKGGVLVPVRLGLLIPPDSGLAFHHTFDTYSYEGCHMTMLGLLKNGAALMVTWDDPYTAAEVRSTLPAAGAPEQRQTLTVSLAMRRTSRRCTVHVLGRGDHADIARAYRRIAAAKGYLTTWDAKLAENPARARLFGASNYKLWSTLTRIMNEESTKEERVTVNWTFDEAAQVAEHLKADLELDRVLFIMGGWIRRGYDNQHPDILPTAPECGGDEAFARCCRKVMSLGYVLSLHDNYQDMYRDAPSWDESYIMKNRDGSLMKGGKWAGGRAYLTCSRRALDLAKRPQNLPAVKKLSGADSYFIDTTYAAGLYECFDPAHPLTRSDDMKWKQELSRYARQLFGMFGSECGREWAIPCSDFFEGMTGVSGGYYHDANLLRKLGATVVPLFEMVYRDCIAMYGKYGYDIHAAAPYVLHHISIGRPLNYHSVPAHLYWKQAHKEAEPLKLRPEVAEFRQTGPRQFSIAYRWHVEKPPAEDWTVFVHFVDQSNTIRFQNDHKPQPPTSRWTAGQVVQGPFTVTVPRGLAGTFDIRAGLYQPDAPAARALLSGARDRERRCILGSVKVENDAVQFVPPPAAQQVSGDPAMYVRGDGGWSTGMHPFDRFVKNTHEILSPLNELTARMPMTAYEFLTEDRLVRRTVFGEGAEAVRVVVNGAPGSYAFRCEAGGEVVLPPYGFAVESPRFVAFCAAKWNGIDYAAPALFTMRSLDGRPLAESRSVRIFHGFGDERLRFGGAEHRVPRQTVLAR